MRIISGYLGGRQIGAKLPEGIRPTTDMGREWLFNVLDNLVGVDGLLFLDLFAGSGVTGLEAISRGGNSHFVDKSKNSIDYIGKLVSAFELNNKQYSITRSDSIKFLSCTELIFDIIFIDPPYKTLLCKQSLDAISSRAVFDNSLIVIETQSFQRPNISAFELIKEKKMGNSIFFILKKKFLKSQS